MGKLFDLFRRDYYKVVRADAINGNFYSLIVNGNDAVEYKLNKWVKSRHKKYNLTVFDKSITAKKFIDEHIVDEPGMGKCLMFKCKIKGKIHKLPVRKMMKGLVIQWDRDNVFPGWPEGTIMAKKVKIYGKSMKLKGE